MSVSPTRRQRIFARSVSTSTARVRGLFLLFFRRCGKSCRWRKSVDRLADGSEGVAVFLRRSRGAFFL